MIPADVCDAIGRIQAAAARANDTRNVRDVALVAAFVAQSAQAAECVRVVGGWIAKEEFDRITRIDEEKDWTVIDYVSWTTGHSGSVRGTTLLDALAQLAQVIMVGGV